MKRKGFIVLCLMMGLALILSGCFGKTYLIQGRVIDSNGDGISGVKLVATGGISATVHTQANGSFQIVNAKGKVTVTPKLDGYVFDKPSMTFEQAPSSQVTFTGVEGNQPSALQVNVKGNGTVTIYPKEDLYLPGTLVTLTPNPGEQAVFSHWNGDLVSEERPTTIIMNSTKQISAVFVEADKVIRFSDSYLEKVVRETVAKPTGLILSDDVANLDILIASIEQIQSLEGIENLTTLTTLDVSKAKVSDITPLATLTGMLNLDLSSNQIDDMSALGELTKLQELNLANNKIDKVNNMIWLSYKDLNTLNLGGNQISDYSSLYRLTNLERLLLNDNQIDTILPLTELAQMKVEPQLREVDLSGNQIKTLETLENGKHLGNLVNLEKLDLSRNQITDIGPIVWLQNTNFTELNLSENQLSSLNPLTNMTNLEVLDLSKTGISDLSALANLTNLKVLKLNGNEITDLTPLTDLPLEELYLHYNLLEDIDPLLELTDTLQKITLTGNEDLNLSTGYNAYLVIEELQNAGVQVLYSFYKNDIPLLEEIGNRVINETETLEFTINATDPDGDDLTYIVEGDLEDYFDLDTLTFSWTSNYDDAGEYTMTFKVSDGEADTFETITITVNNVNRAPILDPIGKQEVTERDTLTFTATASDPDGENLIYSATSDEQWLADLFNPNSRTFTWTPDWFDAGLHTITITVTDGDLSDSETVEINVLNNNRTPVLEPIGNKTVQETHLLEFTIYATDADNESITYSVEGDLTQYFDEAKGKFSWKPTYDDAGEYYITFYASDGDLYAEEQVTITVENLDRPPSWIQYPVTPQTFDEHTEIVLQIAPLVSDLDGDRFEFSFTTSHPSIMNSATMGLTTGEFRWTPVMDDIGERIITFKATANNVPLSRDVKFIINDVEFAPQIISISPLTANENAEHTIVVNAEEWDKDTMTYTATGSSIADRFAVVDNRFTWTPTYDDAGSYATNFTVTDSKGNSEQKLVTITVNNVNRIPEFTSPNSYEVEEGVELVFTVTVNDLDGNYVTVTASSPTGIDQYFSKDTREFRWTPDFTDSGDHIIIFVADDGEDTISYPVTIRVNNHDRSPFWQNGNVWDSGSVVQRYEYDLVSFSLKAQDPDYDTITYAFDYPVGATKIMDGASLNPSTGVFTWNPEEDDKDSYSVIFKAIAGSKEITKEITINISNKEFDPVLDPIGNQVVNEGEELRFKALATDQDSEDVINYVISCLSPTDNTINFDAMLDKVSHDFTWTPDYDDQGVYVLEILAWNPKIDGGSDTERITITVNNAPQFKFISGIDPTQTQVIDIDTVDSVVPYTLSVTTESPSIDNLTNMTASGSAINAGATFAYDAGTQVGTLIWTKDSLKNSINEDLSVTFTAYCNGQSFTKTVNYHVSGTELTLKSFNLSSTSLGINSDLTATLSIENTGDKAAGPFDVTWEVQKWDGSQWVKTNPSLAPSNVAGLAAETTLTPSLTQLFNVGSTEGSYRIYVEIDPNGTAGGPITTSQTYNVEPPKYLLTIDTTIGSGSGTVIKTPNQTTYTSGTTVQLEAVPDPGSYFIGWSANVSATGSSGTITITGDTRVEAEFEQIDLPKKLAFISTRDSAKGELYVLYRNGALQRLTNNDLEELDYQWSPNGIDIIYEARDSSTGQIDLYLVSSVGDSTSSRLTYYTGVEPTFSPDGSSFAYVKDGVPKRIMSMDIYSNDKISGDRLINTFDDATNPAWSPNEGDNAIAFLQNNELAVYRTDSKSYTDITNGDSSVPPQSVTNYVWLPDGQAIAFEANSIIYVVEFLPGDRWIIHQIGVGTNPKVNPDDSSKFYFERNNSVYAILKVIDTFEGASPEIVSLGSGTYSSDLSVTTGEDLVFVNGATSSQNEIYFKKFSNPEPIQLTDNNANDHLSKWAPK